MIATLFCYMDDFEKTEAKMCVKMQCVHKTICMLRNVIKQQNNGIIMWDIYIQNTRVSLNLKIDSYAK